jgi:rhodanese-related sulfurtransferase
MRRPRRDPSFDPPPKKRFPRRGFMLGSVAGVTLSVFWVARYYNIGAEVGSADLSAPDALAQADAGKITLIDIRRPEEWAATGIAQPAVPIDMRRDDFAVALLEAVNGDRAQPVALICARGVRSARLARALREAGFEQVLDVPEGMVGSGAGPGWISRGLPVRQP